MATTTVTNQQLDHVLEDYKIHFTSPEARVAAQGQATSFTNPTNWPTGRHRIPPYRPINRNLNLEERTFGSNGPETAFLTIMFSGVFLNATIAKVWGATGGPFFPKLFKYVIGGEW